MNQSSNFAVTVFAAAMTFTAVSPAQHAQSNAPLAVIDVPFSFEFGSLQFEPGTYTISRVGDFAMKVEGPSNSGHSLVRWNFGVAVSGTSKVVFHHYDSRYFLREVWEAGQAAHLVNSESSAETTLRQARTVNITASAASAPAIEVALQASQD